MAKAELIVGFSYKDMDKDTEAKLRYCANRLQELKKVVAGKILEIGETIAIAHEQFAKPKTGNFLMWVEFEGGFSKSSAYNYMAAFRVFGNIPTVGRIEDSAMYALAQNDTPEKALKEVLKLADNGVKVTQKQAKAIIKKHKEEQEPEQEPEEEEEVEEEPEVVEEPTMEEICEEHNKAIESFCRAIVKQFQEGVPKSPWTEDGRIDSAIASLKAGLTTLRGAKSEVCPACVEGQTEKGKCRYCKGHGYLPVYQAKGIPEDARL